jgi:hypothetical protein
MQGLKTLGVREMTYKMVFTACAIQHLDKNMATSAGGKMTHHSERIYDLRLINTLFGSFEHGGYQR